ncbi:MAG: TonB-dependent receptor, partial [Bacteroidota bacterium]
MNQTPTLRKGIFCLLLPLFISTLSAQQASIVGVIEDATSKEPLTGITVFIESINKGTATDFDGQYQIKDLTSGTYQLSISGIGYAPQLYEVSLSGGQKMKLDVSLAEEAQQLNEVVVKAKSNEQMRREEPIKVEVISVERVLEQSSSLPELINQTSGVKVRQASGVGSSTTININGLQGNAVRYFKDGIPTDYLGYAFNIGLVPTGSIKNIEIFKGVLPIELGADALGGAINIVTKSKDKQYLDASYEVGQFNTHLVNVNGNFIIPNTKIHVGVSSYLSHSDNDYEFDLDVTDFNGMTQRSTFRRFHDAITARFVEGNVGVHNTSWADLLDFKVAYFSLDNEVQHGIRITQPFGEVVQAQTNKIISLNYVKEIAPNLHLNAFGAMADRNSTDQDLSAFLYDWTGEQSQPTPAGEVRLRDQVFDEETKVARLNLRYEINDQFNLKASTTYNSSDRVGADPFGDVNLVTGKQPITIPSTYSKMISGAGFGAAFLGDKLKSETFFKHYMLNAEAASFWGESETEALEHSSVGWGQSLKFSFDENTYTRVSYERATRIPESDEYFGDNLFLLPNPTLLPETSDNINVGFATNLNTANSMSIEVNAFYRDTRDFIRIFPVGIINSINRNSDTQITRGLETNFKIAPDETSAIRVGITYQDLRRK